jgi:hypothetical protein
VVLKSEVNILLLLRLESVEILELSIVTSSTGLNQLPVYFPHLLVLSGTCKILLCITIPKVFVLLSLCVYLWVIQNGRGINLIV